MEKEKIRNRIQEEISKTEEVINEYRELVKPIAPENAIGRVSRMDAINNKSVNEAALRESMTKLSRLQYVLSKVDTADFGLCIKCTSPIPVERILIRPESTHCVKCAT
jgi:DnaK suppressor protein